MIQAELKKEFAKEVDQLFGTVDAIVFLAELATRLPAIAHRAAENVRVKREETERLELASRAFIAKKVCGSAILTKKKGKK